MITDAKHIRVQPLVTVLVTRLPKHYRSFNGSFSLVSSLVFRSREKKWKEKSIIYIVDKTR